MKKRIVVIVGPTAVGKSDYAVDYAIKNNGEIISADSRQVYKGMDIGTGKITQIEMKGIKHYLLDVADPKEQFNVNTFKILAEKAIDDISSRKKLPIICGGTGFYIDAVVNNISYPDVPHNKILRKNLINKNISELFEILNNLDSNFANSLNNSEKNNKQRLIRSIEIATALGKIPKPDKNSPYNVTWIGLNSPFPKLKERIHKRLIKRIEEGMIKEVENLHKDGLSWERMDALGLEYRYVSRFLRKLITKEEMIKKLEIEICHYAKRQMVWFKRNKEIKWIMK
jgi:tRNA dimethylallyltransferase